MSKRRRGRDGVPPRRPSSPWWSRSCSRWSRATSRWPPSSAWRSRWQRRPSARCCCSASGGGGSPTSAPSPGCVVGGLLTGGAVVDNLVTDRSGGWFAALVDQPAAWSVPLAFATMIVVSRLTRHRLPAAHLAVHGPAAHPGDGPARPRLTSDARADASTARRASSTAGRFVRSARRRYPASRWWPRGARCHGDGITAVSRRVPPMADIHRPTAARPGVASRSGLRPAARDRGVQGAAASASAASSSPPPIAFLSWYLLYVVMSNWAHRLHEPRSSSATSTWPSSSGCSSS